MVSSHYNIQGRHFPRRTTRTLEVAYLSTGMKLHSGGKSRRTSVTCQFGVIGISIDLTSLDDFAYHSPRVVAGQVPIQAWHDPSGYLDPGIFQFER